MAWKPSPFAKYLHLYAGTASEHAFEPAIASLGIPYRWQMPVGKYFLDFALPTLKIDIEIDGKSHSSKAQKAKDQERTEYLQAHGWIVVRCLNEEAVEDPYGTLNRLLAQASITQLQCRSR